MAFSGDKTWGVTRDDIILAALRKIGAYDSASGAQAYELTDAALSLNAIVKEWAGEGLGIWLRQRTILFLNYGQPRYYLGPNPTNDTTNRVWHKNCPDNLFKTNTLTAALAAGGTILPVLDASWQDIDAKTAAKPSVGHFVGIRLTNGTMWWDTASAVGTADQITITTGLPAAVGAASGARVYTFATQTTRPVRLLSAYRRSTSNIDMGLNIIARNDYDLLSQKIGSGNPTQVAFEASVTEQTSSALHSQLRVWPVQNSTDCDLICLTTEHYADDLDASANNPQFPVEWANALIWNLAYELAPEYGVSIPERDRIERMALSKKGSLFAQEQENASVQLAPDRSY